MAATLTEVAKRAEVALSTASRAFGEPGRLGAETLRKVLAAAEELGYDPGRSRRTDVTSRGTTVAVVVPDIANPVFGAFVKAAQGEGRHREQTVVLADTAFDRDREREMITRLRDRADGIVVCSPRLDAEELPVLCGRTPAVLVNRETTGVDCVLTDATDGLRQTVDYLAALGHRHLAYVQGSARSWSNAHRLGLVTALAERARMRLDVLGHQAETVAGGTAAAAGVVASEATAVIAHNDLVALGIVAGARALGVHAPADLSVVGFDDIPLAEVTHPALTSIAAPMDRAGAVSVELLHRAVAGERRLPRTVHLPTQLVVRGTTGPVRGGGA